MARRPLYGISFKPADCLFVSGDNFNSCLVAVIAMDPEALKEWAALQNIEYETLEQLCNDQRAREAVLAEMDAVGREAELRGFKLVEAVVLVLEPFTVEDGLLTPTFKIKRPQAKAHFAKAISDMYAELSTSDPSPQKADRKEGEDTRILPVHYSDDYFLSLVPGEIMTMKVSFEVPPGVTPRVTFNG